MAKTQTISIDSATFAKDLNSTLVHQVVTAYLASARQGSRGQKTRSDVRGGGKKPWRQKGSGHARAGTIRSPLWRSGGIIFAARPQDHSQKVNRKMYRAAMRAILSELLRQDRMLVVEKLLVFTPKTKKLLVKLKVMGLENALIVTDSVDENLYLAARNLPNIAVMDVAVVDPVSLVGFDKVLITVSALRKLEENLG